MDIIYELTNNNKKIIRSEKHKKRISWCTYKGRLRAKNTVVVYIWRIKPNHWIYVFNMKILYYTKCKLKPDWLHRLGFFFFGIINSIQKSIFYSQCKSDISFRFGQRVLETKMKKKWNLSTNWTKTKSLKVVMNLLTRKISNAIPTLLLIISFYHNINYMIDNLIV